MLSISNKIGKSYKEIDILLNIIKFSGHESREKGLYYKCVENFLKDRWW